MKQNEEQLLDDCINRTMSDEEIVSMRIKVAKMVKLHNDEFLCNFDNLTEAEQALEEFL